MLSSLSPHASPPRASYPLLANTINWLGILWAGRGNAKRSFLYLIASKEYYDRAAPLLLSGMGAKDAQDMESTLTHNLFYLAQAYGNIGNVKLSCMYCHMVSASGWWLVVLYC